MFKIMHFHTLYQSQHTYDRSVRSSFALLVAYLPHCKFYTPIKYFMLFRTGINSKQIFGSFSTSVISKNTLTMYYYTLYQLSYNTTLTSRSFMYFCHTKSVTRLKNLIFCCLISTQQRNPLYQHAFVTYIVRAYVRVIKYGGAHHSYPFKEQRFHLLRRVAS